MTSTIRSPRTGAVRRPASRVMVALVLAVVASLLPATTSPAAAAGVATRVEGTSIHLAWSASEKSVPLVGLGAAAADDTSTIGVTVSTTKGSLEVPPALRSGLQLTQGTWSDGASVTLEGNRTALRAALPELRLHGDGTRGQATVTITSGAASATSATIYMAELPGPPTQPTVTTNTTDYLVITFGAPQDDGGLPRFALGYRGTATPRSGGDAIVGSCSGDRYCTFPRLAGATDYDFRVAADTPLGFGASSAPFGFTTVAGVPTPVTRLVAKPRDGGALLTWEAPASDGGGAITSYEWALPPTGDSSPRWTSTDQREVLVTGLRNGVETALLVRAVNRFGAGAEQSVSVDPGPKPPSQAPTGASLTTGDETATVAFTPVAGDDTAPVLGYRVTALPTAGGEDVTTHCASSPCTLTGLTNDTEYLVSVAAFNDFGSGPATFVGAATPARATTTVPSAPRETEVEPGNTTVTVRFTAPLGDGGSPITGYEVRALLTGTDTLIGRTRCTGSPCVLDDLVNGTTYDVTVAAVNAVGTGPAVTAGTTTPRTVPDAPTLSAVRGTRSVTLYCSPPRWNGGAPITAYEYAVDDEAGWHPLVENGTGAGRGTVTGLASGTTYGFRVRAISAAGASAPSATVSARTIDVPGAVQGFEVTAGDTTATLAFAAPVPNSGLLVIRYEYRLDEGPWTSTGTSRQRSVEVTGLTNGTTYDVAVRAVNAAGDGPAETRTVTPKAAVTAPGTPALLAFGNVRAAELLVAPPQSDGGSPITGYEYALGEETDWHELATEAVDGTSLRAFLTDLADGTTYRLRIRAVSAGGASAPTAAVSFTTPDVPGTVREVRLQAGDAAATLTFEAPSSDGGLAVSRYEYSLDGRTWTSTGTSRERSVQLTGLTNGTTYDVAVRAVNLAGAGPASASVSVTPVAPVVVPAAPTRLTAVGGDRVLTLGWDKPAGPATVTRYEVSLDGRTWTTVTTTGGARLAAVLQGLRNGQTYAVRVRAVGGSGAGPATAPVPVSLAQWFTDPLSAATRAGLLAVPANPSAYKGPLRATKAAATARDGSPVMAFTALRGRQLQAGQGATMLEGAMFDYAKASLTPQGLDQVRSVVASLRYASAVRCEGNSDFGAAEPPLQSLALARARTVCDTLLRLGAKVRTTREGYGSSRPVVVGGKPADRAQNRRVVIEVTEG